MIVKDDAMVLRMYPFGNTSRVVVWLTQHYGKVATLVKGSQREKSPFLGQYDLFYTCEILFYAREQRSLHILKECAPLVWREAFRADWRACAAASYATGAVDRVMPFGPGAGGLYALLERTLDGLSVRTPGPASIPRFELRLLAELGLAPDWRVCGSCHGVTVVPGGAGGWLDGAAGVLRCGACAGGRGRKLAPATLDAMHRMTAGEGMGGSLPEWMFKEIRDAAGDLLEYHADLEKRPREQALRIVASAM